MQVAVAGEQLAPMPAEHDRVAAGLPSFLNSFLGTDPASSGIQREAGLAGKTRRRGARALSETITPCTARAATIRLALRSLAPSSSGTSPRASSPLVNLANPLRRECPTRQAALIDPSLDRNLRPGFQLKVALAFRPGGDRDRPSHGTPLASGFADYPTNDWTIWPGPGFSHSAADQGFGTRTDSWRFGPKLPI